MIIRRALSQDATELAEFNINMARETEGVELIPEVITAGVEAMIDNPQMGFYLVVELDNLAGGIVVADAVSGLKELADVPGFPLAAEARSAYRKFTFDLDPAPSPDKQYEPDPSATAVYDRLYAEYVDLHDHFGRREDVMKRLKSLRNGAE